MKPQNYISRPLRKKIESELKSWFLEWGADEEEASGFAPKLVDEVMKQRIARTPQDAPDILWSDATKLGDIVLEAKQLAIRLDEEDKLFDLLDQ